MEPVDCERFCLDSHAGGAVALMGKKRTDPRVRSVHVWKRLTRRTEPQSRAFPGDHLWHRCSRYAPLRLAGYHT
jgi:hypothetical protein